MNVTDTLLNVNADAGSDLDERIRWDEWIPESRIMKDDKAGREKQQRLKDETLSAARAAQQAKNAAAEEKASKRAEASGTALAEKAKVSQRSEAKGKKRTRGDAFDTVCCIPD